MFHSMLIINVHEIWLSTVKDAFDSFCVCGHRIIYMYCTLQ